MSTGDDIVNNMSKNVQQSRKKGHFEINFQSIYSGN